MKLSIYIPTLKCDDLFTRCMESIRRSIPPSMVEGVDYEIVVVENVKPLSVARNVGMRRSRGDWIATVDADDMVSEDWFTEIWKAIEKAERMQDIDDIVFDMTVVSSKRSYVDSYGRESVVDAKTLVDDMLRDVCIGNYVWRHVMSRRIVDGSSFEQVEIMEDFVSMPRIIAKARKALYIRKPLYYYISRTESICSTARQIDVFKIAVNRAMEYGGPAIIGASRVAYYMLYNHTDENCVAQHWIRRHFWSELTDRKIGWKWRLKFLTAIFGFVIRLPK